MLFWLSMRTSRRGFTYLMLLLAIVVVAAILYKGFPGQGPASVSSGQLAQAAAQYGKDASAPTALKSAEISGDGSTVTWTDNAGTQYQTTVGSSQEVVQEFDAAGFYNFQNRLRAARPAS